MEKIGSLPDKFAGYTSRGREGLKSASRFYHSLVGFPTRSYRWDGLDDRRNYSLQFGSFAVGEKQALILVDDELKECFPQLEGYRHSESLEADYIYIDSSSEEAPIRLDLGLFRQTGRDFLEIRLVNWGLDKSFEFPSRLYLASLPRLNLAEPAEELSPSSRARTEWK